MNIKQTMAFNARVMKASITVGKAFTTGFPESLVDRTTLIPGKSCTWYNVHVSDIILLSRGIPETIPCALANINRIGEPVFICNNKLLQLPIQYRTAIMEHEYAHIVLGDASNTKLGILKNIILNTLRPFYIPEREMTADEYAAERCGYTDIIDALTIIRDGMRDAFGPKSSPVKELNARIHQLIINREAQAVVNKMTHL